MDSDFKKRIERLEQPAAEEVNWQAQAEAQAQLDGLVAMVRWHMGPDDQTSVAEYVREHAPEEPCTDIERAMFVLKERMQSGDR